MPLRLVGFASGRGSNLAALIQAINSGRLDARFEAVICNMADAPVIEVVRQAGIDCHVIPHKGLSRPDHEAAVWQVLSALDYDYVVLAGYMRLMSKQLLNKIQPEAFTAPPHYRIINIHPSLLPAFPGTNGYEQAFQYGVQVSGVTVHFVDEEMDHGPIYMQAAFERLPNDTLQTFKARGLAVEHELYTCALQQLAIERPSFSLDPDSLRPVLNLCQSTVGAGSR